MTRTKTPYHKGLGGGSGSYGWWAPWEKPSLNRLFRLHMGAYPEPEPIFDGDNQPLDRELGNGGVKIYSNQNYSQAELRKLVPSLNERKSTMAIDREVERALANARALQETLTSLQLERTGENPNYQQQQSPEQMVRNEIDYLRNHPGHRAMQEKHGITPEEAAMLGRTNKGQQFGQDMTEGGWDAYYRGLARMKKGKSPYDPVPPGRAPKPRVDQERLTQIDEARRQGRMDSNQALNEFVNQFMPLTDDIWRTDR